MRRLLTSVLAAAFLLVALPAFAGNGSNLLQYVPSSARIVVGVDVDELRGTALWTRAMSIADGNADLQQTLTTLQNEGGFDPRTAIHTLVFASNEVSDGAGDHALLLFEVDYPAESLANVLTTDNYVASTVGEIMYFRKSESTVAFIGENILAVGEFALVEPALNVAAGQGSAGASGTLAGQISSVDKSGTIWIAAQLPSGSQGAQAARATIDFTSGLAATLNVTMESEAAATEAVTQFNTQIAAVSASPEVTALGLAPVLTGLQASATGADIALQLGVDASTFGTILETLGQLAEEELR